MGWNPQVPTGAAGSGSRRKRKKAGTGIRRIREGLAAWKDSGQWLEDDGQFIPTAPGWLGQAELKAIQQVLRDGELYGQFVL